MTVRDARGLQVLNIGLAQHGIEDKHRMDRTVGISCAIPDPSANGERGIRIGVQSAACRNEKALAKFPSKYRSCSPVVKSKVTATKCQTLSPTGVAPTATGGTLAS